MRKLYLVFVAALILAGSTAAFGQRSAVMKPINQFVNGFNKGDMQSAMAACSEATAIIDEFPPHTWSGAGACQKWVDDYAADAEKNGIKDGVVTLPTVAGALSELQPQVADIVQRLSKVPFDDIGNNLAATLRQANATIEQLTPEARKALAEVQRTLATAQATLERLEPEATKALTEMQRTLAGAQTSLERVDRALLDERAPMQRNLEGTLAEFQRAAQSLRVLSDYLQRHPEALLRGKPADAALPTQ